MELVIVPTLQDCCEDLIKLNHIWNIKHCAWHVIGTQMVAMLLLISFLYYSCYCCWIHASFIFLIYVNCFLVSLPSLSSLDTILCHSSHTIIFDALAPNCQSILFYLSGLLNTAGNITVLQTEPAILSLHPQLGPQLCLFILHALVGTFSVSPKLSRSSLPSEIINSTNSYSVDDRYFEKIETSRLDHDLELTASATVVPSTCLSCLSSSHPVHDFIIELNHIALIINVLVCLSCLTRSWQTLSHRPHPAFGLFLCSALDMKK